MQISILGCGWLGLPLAEVLTKNHTVKGSVSTAAKLSVLQEKGILPFCVDLNNPDEATITEFLRGSEVLVIAIPPKLRAETGISYPEKLKNLLPHIVSAKIKNVLFTSSISVYGESEALSEVDETTLPNPVTESGRQVWAAEKILQQCGYFKTTVVRLGGLTGGERHPVKHLAGKQNVENPLGPVNLVSLEQCLAVLTAIINRAVWGEIFVVVYPEPQNRSAYYTQKAAEYGLPAPQFVKTTTAVGKIVKGQEKLLSLLNIAFV